MALTMFCLSALLRPAAEPAQAADLAAPADLEVIIDHLRSNNGDVHIALYDKAETFPDSDGMLHEVHVPITDRRARTIFKGLKPGRYAIAVYHDENSNHEFDQGLFGIPLENYAFSNDARVFFAPPAFEAAAFSVPASRRVRILINDAPQ